VTCSKATSFFSNLQTCASSGTPTPEPSDEEMPDVDANVDADPDADSPDVSAPASDAGSDAASPEPTPLPRRRGRPPRAKPNVSEYDTIGEAENGSDVSTPMKKRRGRPPSSYQKKTPRGGPSHVTQVPIDKAGNMMDVINDEVNLPEDPEGETKVDKFGNLQGARDYRCRTFTVLGRGNRLYMLSTEPARCMGFRDSYLFFQKHQQLYKIIIDEQEKFDLIDRDIIPHSYKGRAIGICTARSVFREFGARIIVGGRRIIDDYKVSDMRAEGYVEGEIADPNDRLPRPGEPYNKNQYVAWHGASQVYHTSGPTVPLQNVKPEAKKRKVTVTDVNWMLEHAREASRFNTSLVTARKDNQNGVYDIHTNQLHYPAITQPTHARWETLPPPSLSIRSSNSSSINSLDDEKESLFTPPTEKQLKNNLIVDTIYTSPQFSGPLERTGARIDEYRNELSFGTAALSDVTDDIIALLPPDCQQAFHEAVTKEQDWASEFGNEVTDAGRAKLRIGLEPKFLGAQ
jgi:chromatin structure-remodeling complex protein RSC7